MRVTIHRGAKQIGGNCVEVEYDGQRIVLDVGLPIDSDGPKVELLPRVIGFREECSDLLGVFISHPHPDHYGLASLLPKSTKIFIGSAAQRILEAAIPFGSFGLKIENPSPISDSVPIQIGSFRVTPWLVDHSAYDSYSFLVEAGGKKLFYSADFRSHGRKGRLFDKLISSPPDGVSCMILEGTNIESSKKDGNFQTEQEIELQMADHFRECDGMPLVWCSSQNIDRLVSIYKACRRTNRILIIDIYTAEILRATQNERIPQAHWDGIRVYLPKRQKRQIIRNHAFDVSNRYAEFRIYPENLESVSGRAVMLFRPSMIDDFEPASSKFLSTLIYSLWPGYLDLPRNESFIAWLDAMNIKLVHCHTSGHATVEALMKLRQSFSSASVVPIHLNNPERFAQVFPDAKLVQDQESWLV